MRKYEAKVRNFLLGTIYTKGFIRSVKKSFHTQDLTPSDERGSQNCYIRNTAYALDENYYKVAHNYARHRRDCGDKYTDPDGLSFELEEYENGCCVIYRYLKTRDDLEVSGFNTGLLSIEEFYSKMKDTKGKYIVVVTEEDGIEKRENSAGHMTVLEDGHFADMDTSMILDSNWFVRYYAKKIEIEAEK